MIIRTSISRALLKTTVAFGALACAGFGYAPSASAADGTPAADGPGSASAEIIVTANKKEENLHNVANSITAISGRDLELRVLTDFQDFAAQVPGLQIQQISDGQNRLIVRGENAGGGAANVGTVIDEMPLSYSTGNASGATTTNNPDTYDTQRIEVLRGPQGTLYGAGAEAGLIKYVTNKPVLNKLEAGIEIGGVTVDHGQSAGNVKGFLNIPVTDTFALRVTGYAEDLPGWIGNWVTGERNLNHGYRDGVRITALWEPSKDLKITAQAATQQMHDYASGSVDLVGSSLTPSSPPANQFALAQGLTYGSPLANFEDFQEYHAYVQIDYDAHFARITSITSHGILGSYFKVDDSGAELAPGITYPDYLAAYVYGQPVDIDEQNPLRLYKTTQELRIASEPGATIGGLAVDWQLGGMITRELTHWTQSLDVLAASSPGGPPLMPPGGSAELNAPYFEKAVFADATVHFTPVFDLELGGRYSNIIETSQVNQYCCILFGQANTSLPGLRTNQSHADWSVAPRFHISQDTLVYARIASGFRAGGPEILIPDAPAGFPLSYKPDRTINYELGLRTYLLDKKVSIDLAAYYISWTDVQVNSEFAAAGSIFNVLGNAGTAKSEGVEWNLAFAPVAGLSLGIVGDVDNARLTQDAPGLGGNNGDPLTFVPSYINTVNLDYHHAAFGNYEFFIGGTWTHTGRVYNDFVNPASASVLGSRVELPGYDTFAMQGGLRNGKVTFEVFAHNLSDSRALIGYYNSGAYGLYGSGTILQPRTIGFRLSYKY